MSLTEDQAFDLWWMMRSGALSAMVGLHGYRLMAL